MILPDINALIYAFRRDLPQHDVCHSWPAAVVSGDARFGLSPDRVERRGPDHDEWASAPDAEHDRGAFGFCEDLVGQPIVRLWSPVNGTGTFSDDYVLRPTPQDLA